MISKDSEGNFSATAKSSPPGSLSLRELSICCNRDRYIIIYCKCNGYEPILCYDIAEDSWQKLPILPVYENYDIFNFVSLGNYIYMVSLLAIYKLGHDQNDIWKWEKTMLEYSPCSP